MYWLIQQWGVSCIFTLRGYYPQGYFPYVELAWLIFSSLRKTIYKTHYIHKYLHDLGGSKCGQASCPRQYPDCGFFIDCLKTTNRLPPPLHSTLSCCYVCRWFRVVCVLEYDCIYGFFVFICLQWDVRYSYHMHMHCWQVFINDKCVIFNNILPNDFMWGSEGGYHFSMWLKWLI